MKKLATITIFVLFAMNSSFSQPWVQTWQSEKNFYKIQDAFNAYCKTFTKEEEEENELGIDDEGLFPGYAQFKRWEAYVEPRVYPSGDLTQLANTWNNYKEFLDQSQLAQGQPNGNSFTSAPWVAMGPFGPLSGLATNGLPRKAGRINFITYKPGSPNTYWIGAAAGGLWKTTDNGTTWNTTNGSLSVIGCTDLAIDPTNGNIMYLATGDGYGSFRDPSSIGVLKSTDGGATWNTTGLTFAVSAKTEMRKIIINPVNPLTVMCATTLGIYRNTNGGTGAWTNVMGLNTFDIEFKPNSKDTIYAGGLSFRRSVDGGVTWTQISNGIPTSGSTRMEVATTPANPNLVYVLSSTLGSAGLQGVYRSTNGGTSFTLMANTPDIVASDCFITSTVGQGWYDLALDASPLNANELVAGGLGVWRSTDGGATWANIGCAYNWNSSVPYIHTDHQELEYTAAGILYSVNDGGIYQYTGSAWTDVSAPMDIAQIYKIGLSSLSANLWLTGHQDNGSNIFNNGVYSASLAADGADCFIDRTNDQNMFASISQGQFNKSTNGGANWNACTNGLTAGGWISPWKQDPSVASTLYAGRGQMFRSVNYANSWSQTPGTMNGVVSNEFVTEFAIAPSNNQYIYAIHGQTGVFTTTNAGTTWTLNNSGLPIASARGSFVTVDPVNPQVAWITFSGYSAGNKVFKTINGGTTWQNISYNLPNLPANCSVYEMGNINGRIYVGMEVGVYYIDNSSVTWTLYNTSLPNTPVLDLEISPAAPTKLRAATYGRGVYQTDVMITTGVLQEANGKLSFNVFPNPSSDLLTVNINTNKTSDFELEIRTVTGSLVLTQALQFGVDKSEAQLNISSLANGLYFLQVVSEEGNSGSVKIIKQ